MSPFAGRATRAFLCCFLALSFSCQPAETKTADVAADDSLDEGAELQAELKANVPGLTVWVRPQLKRAVRADGRVQWVLRGRASKNLGSINSYVFDDPYGVAQLVSARAFEVTFDDQSELNSLLAGQRLFIALVPAGQSGAQNATASLTFEPKLFDFTGSSAIWVRAALEPIENDGLLYRGDARVPAGSTLSVAPAGFTLTSQPLNRFTFDARFDALRPLLGGRVTLSAGKPDGTALTKSALLSPSVASLELTRADAYDTWPPTQCSLSTQACLDQLPFGTLDTEPCGNYQATRRCNLPGRLPNLYVSPDDLTGVTAAVAATNQSLSDGRQVSMSMWGVQSGSNLAPSLAQVKAAYLAMVKVPGLNDVGPLTAAQLATELKMFNAQSVLTAMQTAVFSQSVRAAKVTRQGPTGRATYLVLQFPDAWRLGVLELSAP